MADNLGVWGCANQWEWIRRVAKQELPPLIITVAITGGAQGKETNPNHPEVPEEQAKQTYDAYRAGASIVHVHARRPDNPSMMSSDPARYREINALIRERCPDIIINNTTGGGLHMSMEERRATTAAGPEICSLNMGPLASTMTLKKRKPPLTGRPDDIHIDEVIPLVTFGETEAYAKVMLEKGIKPEMEVYHAGQWWLVQNLIDKGLVQPPYLVQFPMGLQAGTHATPKNLLYMLETAPVSANFSVAAIGPWQTPMLTMAILLGLNVRTGMEDNVYYSRGELCRDNAHLVERVVRIARELGREIATPKQARQMLGLSEKPSSY